MAQSMKICRDLLPVSLETSLLEAGLSAAPTGKGGIDLLSQRAQILIF